MITQGYKSLLWWTDYSYPFSTLHAPSHETYDFNHIHVSLCIDVRWQIGIFSKQITCRTVSLTIYAAQTIVAWMKLLLSILTYGCREYIWIETIYKRGVFDGCWGHRNTTFFRVVCVCTLAHIGVLDCVYLCVCICVCACMCMCIYMCVYVCVYMCIVHANWGS